MTLQEGDVAPAFALYDQYGDRVQFDHYVGWRLVWWLPSTMAEHAQGCSDRIAQGFAAHPQAPLSVFGVSFDSETMMRTFAMKAAVVFPMLSDETKETGKAYGVYRGDEDEWNCFPMKRAFLVGPDGRIAKVYSNIDPDFFVHEVLADLEELLPRHRTGLLGRVLSSLKG